MFLTDQPGLQIPGWYLLLFYNKIKLYERKVYQEPSVSGDTWI